MHIISVSRLNMSTVTRNICMDNLDINYKRFRARISHKIREYLTDSLIIVNRIINSMKNIIFITKKEKKHNLRLH